MFLTAQESSIAGQHKNMSVVHPKGRIQQQDEHSCGLAILLVGMFLIRCRLILLTELQLVCKTSFHPNSYWTSSGLRQN